jgi:hypothetical protein
MLVPAGTVKESGKLISLSGEPVPDVGSEHVIAGERRVKPAKPLPERQHVIRGQGDVPALQRHASASRSASVTGSGSPRLMKYACHLNTVTESDDITTSTKSELA